MRRIPHFVAIVATIITFSAPTASADSGANNVVLARNSTDATSVTRDRLQIARAASDTVGNENVASAQSTGCVSCRTVAVAIQVVIVESYPSDFHPANAAAAANGGCDSCTTYAFAYQDIVQPGRVVYFSGDAQRRLNELRMQVDAVASDTTLSFLDMKAQLDGLVAQIVATVSEEMRAAGANADSQVRADAQVA